MLQAFEELERRLSKKEICMAVKYLELPNTMSASAPELKIALSLRVISCFLKTLSCVTGV